MMRPGAPGGASAERRRWQRVRLAMPAHFSRGRAAHGEAVSSHMGDTIDIGTGGVYLTTREQGDFVPGEMVTVSLAVPWEYRREFPFSRIVGPSHIVRVDPTGSDEGPKQGIALAFCSDQMTMLGAIVTIR